jgi:hypothetical protein
VGRCLQKGCEQAVKYCVIVSPEAENDLKEIFSWYEDKRMGLGYGFLLQIEAGINFVKRNPEIDPIEYTHRTSKFGALAPPPAGKGWVRRF